LGPSQAHRRGNAAALGWGGRSKIDLTGNTAAWGKPDVRWLARLYPKHVFADRRAALSADIALLAVGIAILVAFALALT